MRGPDPDPDHSHLVELHDRIANDPRRRDDRSQFIECERCGRPFRWVANLGSAHRGNLPIVARVKASAAHFDPQEHAGLVAVFTDRTGFTVGHFTQRDDVEGAFLYECHWDVCEDSRRERDRLSSRRPRRGDPDDEFREETAAHRYAQWLRAGRRDNPET